MRKIFILSAIIFIIVILTIVLNIYVMSLPPKLKDIEQINLYLKEFDFGTFNVNDIIEVTDKKEIQEILDILKLENREIASHSKGVSFQHNPPGFFEIVFKNKKVKRYEYFETKIGYYFENNKYFYFAYYNDSLKELQDKYIKTKYIIMK